MITPISAITRIPPMTTMTIAKVVHDSNSPALAVVSDKSDCSTFNSTFAEVVRVSVVLAAMVTSMAVGIVVGDPVGDPVGLELGE